MGLLEIVSGENNVRGISGTVIFVINTLSKSVLNAVSHILPLKKNNDLLFDTVCSSEHKVCSDEKSSTYMTGAALHWGHVQQWVLWSLFTLYDVTPMSSKEEKKQVDAPVR